MAYSFTTLETKLADIKKWLTKEFGNIRTGRASPTLLDGITVESYGSKMSIQQVASMTTEDARTIRVVPWDASTIKSIEKAITDAGLGVSVGADDKGVRVFFPELTAERRQSLLKIAKDKLEDARISVKKERDDVWSDIQAKEKEGEIGEDEKFAFKDEMQERIDKTNSELEELFTNKEKEIQN
ncbi:MAG: ribosome recycling factor [Candidatus Paceibacterota bacterium]